MAPPDIDLEIGRSGLDVLDGYVHDEKLKQLASPTLRVKTYREMSDNDAVVGAIIFSIDMMIRQLHWRVEPYGGSAASESDKAAATFVSSCFDDLNRPFKDVLSEILSFLVYGWSWHEMVYKKRNGPQQPVAAIFDPAGDRANLLSQKYKPSSTWDDNMIGWHKFAGRVPESLSRWEMDGSGELVGMRQMAPPTWHETFIPLHRSLHFRASSNRNSPEGRSILRNAYRSWYFKKIIEEIQAIGIERDLAGLPVLYVPEDLMRKNLSPTMQALRDDLEKMVRNVRRGNQEGILAPRRVDGESHENLYELTLLSSSGRRQFDTVKILEYYDQRIAMTTLNDFVLVGHESFGSYAMIDSKTDFFTVAVGAWVDMVADQFNDKAIPQLMRLNKLDTKRPPKLVHNEMEHVDLKTLGEYVERLIGANIIPNSKDLGDHMLAQARLPGGQETEL